MIACECPDCGHEFDAEPENGHKLLCGDATSADDVARLGDHGHLMITDPPYGVDYDPRTRNDAWGDNARDRKWKPLGAKSLGIVTNDDQADWSPAWLLFSGDVAYVWSGSRDDVLVVSGSALMASGFELRSQIIWRKQAFAIGRSNYHYQHEPC